MKLPKCCGKDMYITVETTRFYEVQCNECGDTVFIRKEGALKPQMLDD